VQIVKISKSCQLLQWIRINYDKNIELIMAAAYKGI